MTTMATRLVYRAARGLAKRGKWEKGGGEGSKKEEKGKRGKRENSLPRKANKVNIGAPFRIGERAYRAGKEDTDTGRR